MKVLLHACCGPCSIEPARLLLEQGHDITIAYLNSNIDDSHEYKKRLDTLLAWADNEGIEVVEGIYDPKQWNTVIAQHWHAIAFVSMNLPRWQPKVATMPSAPRFP